MLHPAPTACPAAWEVPLLLHIEERDGVRVPKQEVSGAGVEDLVAVGHLHFLGDLVLQILDQKLK